TSLLYHFYFIVKLWCWRLWCWRALVLAPLVLAPLCWRLCWSLLRLWCWRLWCWRLWCWRLWVLAPLVLAPLVLAPLVLALWCWRLWCWAGPLCWAGAGASGAGASGAGALVLAPRAGASGAGAPRSSHSFAFGEYQPKTSELAVQASGPEGAPRCKEKLEQLALLVRNQWNGHVRIRVHHAWMPKHDAYWDSQVGHRGLESLHFSGRAVDMSLLKLKPNLNYRDVTLGRLAQLAYYQAYFDYCKVFKGHCALFNDPMDSDWLACFPSKATVVKRHHGNSGNHNNSNNAVVAIDTLTPGDEILTLDELTGKQVFTRVLGYHHKLGDSEATYLKIQLANGHQLEVSPNHLVFSTSATSLKIRPTYAADLSIGDRLMTPQSSDGGWTGVVKISVRHRRGRYAPMTSAGHLLVNGVWVSSYAHTRHQAAAHVLFCSSEMVGFPL
uniref:Hedgehog protein n=1 Tax=Macrostomum lignano TaxID=282301 RepID=A0A1I8FC53_9PLAT